MKRRGKRKGPSTDYKVGYGKPPREHQFQRGNAGNRKGRRRKQSKSEAETLREAFSQLIELQIGGTKRKVTAFEAMVLTLRSKALRGDLAAVKVLIGLFKDFTGGRESEEDWAQLSSEDVRILKEHYSETMEAVGFAEKNGSVASATDPLEPRADKNGS